MKAKALLISLMIAANGFAQGVIDVHSHIITPEFMSALESEGRLMDEGFPLPKYNVENHLKWMDEAGIETSVLTLAAPKTSQRNCRSHQEGASWQIPVLRCPTLDRWSSLLTLGSRNEFRLRSPNRNLVRCHESH